MTSILHFVIPYGIILNHISVLSYEVYSVILFYDIR